VSRVEREGNEMTAHNRKVPDKATLERWSREGLTHQQMADRTLEETGQRVTRAAISMAMQRYGLATQKARYNEEVPWRVRVEHLRAYPVRMLRMLGRRRAGEELDPEANERLDRWLATLVENDAVVAYDPDSDVGFHYVARTPDDGPLPVRVRRVYTA
jgi:hypothetical protein